MLWKKEKKLDKYVDVGRCQYWPVITHTNSVVSSELGSSTDVLYMRYFQFLILYSPGNINILNNRLLAAPSDRKEVKVRTSCVGLAKQEIEGQRSGSCSRMASTS